MFGRMITSQRFISYQNCNLILEPEDDRGGIYLGDYTAAIDLNLLKQKGIKTVLTVATGLPVSYSKDSGIYHKIYQALDIESYNLAKHFPDTYKQIDEGLMRGNVYVHCAAGISRSSSTVIAYLMKKFGWTYVKAHGFVRGKRPVISPNNGFIRQLRNYERQLKLQQQQSPINEDSNQQKQSQPQIFSEEKANFLEEDENLRMHKNIQMSDKKKQFSQSAQKYIPLKNKLSKEQEEQKEPFPQPNIVTYGAKNNLIIKKGPQLPYLNKHKF